MCGNRPHTNVTKGVKFPQNHHMSTSFCCRIIWLVNSYKKAFWVLDVWQDVFCAFFSPWFLDLNTLSFGETLTSPIQWNNIWHEFVMEGWVNLSFTICFSLNNLAEWTKYLWNRYFYTFFIYIQNKISR